jgi:hypothetical protein
LLSDVSIYIQDMGFEVYGVSPSEAEKISHVE